MFAINVAWMTQQLHIMETLLNGTDRFQIDKEMFCAEENREIMPTAGLNCLVA